MFCIQIFGCCEEKTAATDLFIFILMVAVLFSDLESASYIIILLVMFFATFTVYNWLLG